MIVARTPLFVLEDWEIALFGFFVFVLLLIIVFKLWRDPTLRRLKVGVFVERERYEDYKVKEEWPKPRDDEPTLHDWDDKP